MISQGFIVRNHYPRFRIASILCGSGSRALEMYADSDPDADQDPGLDVKKTPGNFFEFFFTNVTKL